VGPNCQWLVVGASWAWATFWPGPVSFPAAVSFFCSNHFSFSVFETRGFVLQQELHKFESLQICKICKMGQRVFELNKTQTRRKSKRKDFRRNKIGSPNLFDQF
jgi:hypothetical protein